MFDTISQVAQAGFGMTLNFWSLVLASGSPGLMRVPTTRFMILKFFFLVNLTVYHRLVLNSQPLYLSLPVLG